MVSCAEMKKLEKSADEAGLSYYDMMENAGTCAAMLALSSSPEMLTGGKVVVFCGKGNNGGDGFVLARRLSNYNCKVTVVLVAGEPQTDDAVTNYKELSNPETTTVENVTITEETPDLSDAKVVVDAMYGTGFKGTLRPEAAKIVEAINALHGTGTIVIALDIPSGLPGDIDREEVIGPCVIADKTLAFHDKKYIHDNIMAVETVLGEVTVADIGINEALSLTKDYGKPPTVE